MTLACMIISALWPEVLAIPLLPTVRSPQARHGYAFLFVELIVPHIFCLSFDSHILSFVCRTCNDNENDTSRVVRQHLEKR